MMDDVSKSCRGRCACAGSRLHISVLRCYLTRAVKHRSIAVQWYRPNSRNATLLSMNLGLHRVQALCSCRPATDIQMRVVSRGEISSIPEARTLASTKTIDKCSLNELFQWIQQAIQHEPFPPTSATESPVRPCRRSSGPYEMRSTRSKWTGPNFWGTFLLSVRTWDGL